jgi:hypothetical protein
VELDELMAGKLLSQRAAAAKIGVPPRKLREWTRLGEFPVFVDPRTGRWRYSEPACEAWLLEHFKPLERAS